MASGERGLSLSRAEPLMMQLHKCQSLPPPHASVPVGVTASAAVPTSCLWFPLCIMRRFRSSINKEPGIEHVRFFLLLSAYCLPMNQSLCGAILRVSRQKRSGSRSFPADANIFRRVSLAASIAVKIFRTQNASVELESPVTSWICLLPWTQGCWILVPFGF